jgi:hypothetical protein
LPPRGRGGGGGGGISLARIHTPTLCAAAGCPHVDASMREDVCSSRYPFFINLFNINILS